MCSVHVVSRKIRRGQLSPVTLSLEFQNEEDLSEGRRGVMSLFFSVPIVLVLFSRLIA